MCAKPNYPPPKRRTLGYLGIVIVFGLAMAAMGWAIDTKSRAIAFLTVLPLIGIGVFWAEWLEDYEGIRSVRLLRREINSREALSSVEFYEKYYGDSSLDPILVERCRHVLAKLWNIAVDKLQPDDELMWYYGECAWEELVTVVEREFSVKLDDSDSVQVDGTLDTLVRWLSARQLHV